MAAFCFVASGAVTLTWAGPPTVPPKPEIPTTTPAPATPDQATLTLTITGLQGHDGVVYLALYDRPETFPEDHGMRAKLKADVTGETLTLSIPHLAPGRYAVAAYHDQNDNGVFDQGLFGVPLEGFGFTRDAAVFPVGPTFDDAAITVTAPRTEARFRMRYGL